MIIKLEFLNDWDKNKSWKGIIYEMVFAMGEIYHKMGKHTPRKLIFSYALNNKQFSRNVYIH